MTNYVVVHTKGKKRVCTTKNFRFRRTAFDYAKKKGLKNPRIFTRAQCEHIIKAGRPPKR